MAEYASILSKQESELRILVSLGVERGKGQHTPHLEIWSPYRALEREHRLSSSW